jgi:hypothetical protein
MWEPVHGREGNNVAWPMNVWPLDSQTQLQKKNTPVHDEVVGHHVKF